MKRKHSVDEPINDNTAGEMKLGKKPWLANLIRDLSPTSNGTGKEFVTNTSPKICADRSLPTVVKVLGSLFAMIGILVCLRWFVTIIITLEILPTFALSSVQTEQSDNPHTLRLIDDECTPNEVITEFSNRLQLLENAFKEQVFARETIAREVNDQSDIYTDLEDKLDEVLEKIKNISLEYKHLESKYRELHERVYSDEMLSMVVVLVLVLEILIHCRPLFTSLWHKSDVYKHRIKSIIPWYVEEHKNTSRPSTPKHGAGLRNEICLTTLQTNNAYQNVFDALLRPLDGIKIAAKPYFGIFSADDIKNMPVVRLYVLIVDIESRPLYCNGTDSDLLSTTVRFTKSIRSNIVIVLSNDEGSRNLTAHSIYNSSIRLVKNNDFLQDLASHGRLFSIWQEMTSHQISHLRRTIKTVLNLKSNVR